MSRPPHRRLLLVLAVGAGGALGTGARHGLAQLVPTVAGWPLATLTANLLGAFLLGMLLEALLRRGAETPRGMLLRLGAGDDGPTRSVPLSSPPRSTSASRLSTRPALRLPRPVLSARSRESASAPSRPARPSSW